MTVKARVTVYPRQEVLDPQGRAIGDALHRIGFGEVSDVRAGKSFLVELDTVDRSLAEKRVRQMCEQLLANAVVEEFEVEMLTGNAR